MVAAPHAFFLPSLPSPPASTPVSLGKEVCSATARYSGELAQLLECMLGGTREQVSGSRTEAGWEGWRRD